MSFGIELADALSDKGYAVMDNFLDPVIVEDLRQLVLDWFENDKLKQAGIGQFHEHTIVKDVRGDLIRWIDNKNPNPLVKGYLDKIGELMHFLNRYCYLGLKDAEMHYTTYPVGKYYERHSDLLNISSHRVISTVLYLNPHWTNTDGGELVIYHNDVSEVKIEPLAGRLVIFRSELEHEVLTTKVERVSITGWLLDQYADLTFL